MTVHSIGQRELRNDNAEIIRRVEAGESFTVTRHGKPVADLVPHRRSAEEDRVPLTVAEALELLRTLPPIDVDRWYRERAEDDEIFGPDVPEDPWERR